LPDGILADLRGADYVVDVHNYWDGYLDEEILKDLDFTPVADASLDPSHYHIWRRQAVGSVAAEPGTALNRRKE
jgi:hypothetical protein